MKAKASKSSKKAHKNIAYCSYPFEEGGLFGTDPRHITKDGVGIARKIVKYGACDDSEFTALSAWSFIEAAKTLARHAMKKAGKLSGDWQKLADYMSSAPCSRSNGTKPSQAAKIARRSQERRSHEQTTGRQ